MAKSSRGGRGLITPTHRPLMRSIAPAFPLRPSPTPLSFSDRRIWHPLGPIAPVFSTPRSASRIQPAKIRKGASRRFYTPTSLAFAEPKAVHICVRRKQRKEVLFAKNKAGRSGQRKPRRNYWSSISCR